MHKRLLVVLAVLLVPLVLIAGPTRKAVQPFSDGKTDRLTATGGSATLSKAPASPDATSAALATAADWLLARQDVSGGFPWSLGDATLYGNVQGPAGRGVLKAYQYTGNAAYRTAALNSGNFFVPSPPVVFTDGDARLSTYDALFLEELSAVTGDSKYATFIQNEYWNKLTGGTYGETNNLDAAAFCDLVITARASIRELTPWDLAGVAVGAHVAGESGIAAVVMSKILEALNSTTESDNEYDVIGLAGAVWASAVTGIDLDPTVGIYAADNSTAALAARLAALQQTGGAWMWSAQNPACVPTDQTNFDTQVTAFAVLALKAFDAATYHDQIYKGAGFLLSMQQPDGQMLVYPTAAPTADGGVETHAEALTAIVAVRPDDVFVDDSWASATPGLEVATGKFFGFNAFATLQDGVDASLSGHSVSMAEGTYPLASNVTLNKANLTVQGAGSTLTVLQVSGTGNRLTVSAEGITIQDLQIVKTDKTGGQDIIYVGADNFTLKNNVISGQYIMGDPEVSRAMVVTYGITGLHIEGNTIHHLRQPAYINGSIAAPTTGPILNNAIYATRGWVIDGANMTFTGNTWGDGTLAQQNWKDIAIIPGTSTHYPDILAVGLANNNAMVEDQRVSPPQNTIVYVTPGATGDGSPHGPLGTLTAGVARTVAGGTIYASAGTYNESVTLTKRVTLDGAGSGSDPATNTVIVGSGAGTGITTVAGESAALRTVIKDVYLTNFFTGVSGSSYLTLDNVAAANMVGLSNRGLELPPLQDLSISGCKFNGNSIGMRTGTATNISNVTIANSEFNNNVQGWFIAGAPSVGSASFANVQVTNCTFNNNLQKGLYIEKLSDAVFDGITVSNSGTDPTYGFNNGIDINLKHGTYQNIQIRNSTITGSGATGTATNPYNPAAVTIKARDDAPSYNSPPATLNNVVIEGCTIEGPQNALRFGEFDKVNASPTAVVIKNTVLTGSGVDKYHLVNNTMADILATEGNTFTGSTTLAQIEAKIRHGLDDPALGVVNYGQFVPSSEVWVNGSWAGASPGDPVDGHWFGTDAFATIQAGINAVLVPGTVNVAAGTYAEAVTLNKSQITLRGAASGGAIINPGNTALNALTLAGNQLIISRLTLTGGKNGVYGTTANSRLLSLVVTGNAENGIQLVDADNNLIQATTISSHPAGAGIRLTGARQNTVSGNTVQTNNYNVLVEISGARNAIGNIIQGNTLVSPGTWGVLVTNEPQTTAVNFNVFGPATSGKYIRNSSITVSLDAQFNWFGGETTFDAGDFEGLVNTNGAYATEPTVAIFPVTHFMPQSSTVNISVMALIPSATTVKGTDINLSWDNEAAIPDEGDPLEGPFFAAAGSTFFEFTRPTISSLRVNQSLLSTGGVTGGSIPYVNVLFTQAFKSGTADGVNHILLNSVQMRDPENAPITVNLDPDPIHQATLIVDGTPPSVTVAIDNQTNLWTDAWLKNGDQIAVTATITDAYTLTASDIAANLGGLFGGIDHTADHPASYVVPLATWPVVASASCNPANGDITVTVTATDALGNVGTGSATIKADNMAPNALTNFRANAGHNKVNLTWDDPSGGDPTYRGVLVRYARWTGYPDYTGAGPAFPANETAGDGPAVLVTGAVFAASHTINPVDRDIYYYRGFVFDQAGNYSLANGSGNDADRSTNYILGDLGSGPGNIGDSPYDGSVDFDDLSLFSLLYFEPDANGPGWPYAAAKEADFGPTSNNKTHGIGSSFGIPDNDGAVEFEDLMIFSMNYNYTAPPKITVPPGSTRASAFALSMIPQSSSASEYVVALRIDNDGRSVKGASAELRFDPKVLQVSGVTRGDLLGGENQSFHGHRAGEGMLRVDCALLGKGLAVEHSGNLATVHFRVLSQGDPALRLAGATVRNAVNGEVAVELTETVAELPTTFDLAQNYPNPFNPATTIKYQVPSPVNVEVTVFNILGEKITTLVNEVQAAGFYTLEWNGRDSRNLAVPTGLYFYTMRAGDFSSVKKMMLMK